MGQLDAIASASGGLLGDSRRLSFGKSMAAAATSKIMPAGQKALSTSGSVVVAQEFAADPVKLGQPPTSLLSVLQVITQLTGAFSYLRQSVRTNAAGHCE